MLTKTSLLRTIAAIALLLGTLFWLYGGARSGLYQTYYEVMRVDEVTGLEYPERVDAFRPGIEPLVAGFVLFAALLAATGVIETRAKPSKQEN